VTADTQETSASLPIERVLEEEARVLAHEPGEASTALCLSGGGVRSASFGLGVLQGLARAGVLGSFDYLSTVSGGGYIGGWLSSWRLRAHERGEPDPCRQLAEGPVGRPEPETVSRLRHLIKFLDPRTGGLSADVWTLTGTIVRNLLVNWMVLVPLIAAAAMLPRLYLGLLGLPSQPELVSRETLEALYRHHWMLVVVLVAIASVYAALELPSLGRRASGLHRFLIWFLAPVLLVHVVASVHRYWAWRFGSEMSLASQVLLSSAGMVLPWIVGGALSGRLWRPWIWIAAALAGAAGRLAAWWAHHDLTALAHHDPQVFVVIDLTISLLMFFLQIALFIGLASREMTDEDREWWARAGAWVLISAMAWGVASTVVILGPLLFDAVIAWLGVSHAVGRGGLGVVTVLSGAAAHGAASASMIASGAGSRLKRLAFVAAAPLIAVLLIVLASDGNRLLLITVHNLGWFPEHRHPVGAALPEDLIVLGALAGLALLLGHVIAINRFSLHGMYRDRLVRTFLGVSRPAADRRPSPFTGFDAGDDVAISRLAEPGRPLHVVNATLNLVAEHRLATAERKSASFTISPLHAGSADVGYRPAARYAGGITLGQALTTSGAAVNPNMGAASSPALTFLLTVFNARLGVWLGNPGAPGHATWTKAAPTIGVTPLVNEAIGRTTDRNPYVNLSDGGHFENLGLYEMIRRRCRYIVVSDAGADPGYAFGDLANAIRLVRIDFGVDIEFPAGVHIGGPEAGPHPLRWAVGTISYRRVDPEAEDGILLYLKPTILGDEPVDVANYARAHPLFPHQATSNQWFDDAQFESYRALGLHTVQALCRTERFATARDLCVAIAGRSGA
jgi:hypothetical protein